MSPTGGPDAGRRSEKESPRLALVAGGGIGGLAAALALHRLGMRVQVFEQAATPAEVGAGINLLPGGVKVLHDLGLKEAIRSTGPSGGAGVETSELIYCGPKGTTILREMRGLAAGFDTPQYSIHRGWLHRMLLHSVEEAIGKDNVHFGHHFASFEQDANSVTAHFKTAASSEERYSSEYSASASFSGDILIGADGIRSKVRAQMFPGETASFTGWRIYRGVLEVDSQIYDGRSMLIYGSGSVVSVLYPISERNRQAGGTLLNWGINCHDSVLAPHLRGAPGEESWTRRVSKDEFLHLLDGWKFPEGCFPDPSLNFSKLVQDTPGDSVSCYALFDRDPSSHWSVGRVTLLGDAAHPLLPFGSQGAGQAMLDVAALIKAITSMPDDLPGALQVYEKSRADAAAKVVLTNRNMGPTRVLKMFEDAVGDKDAAEQARWVEENRQRIVDFSNSYQSMSGLSTKAPTPAASGHGTPFNGTVGFGERPALVLVDFCKAYTTPGSPWYCGDRTCGVVEAVAQTVELLKLARERGLPVIFTRVVFQPGLDHGLIFVQKVPSILAWTEDNPLTHICPEVAPIDGEEVIVKKHPGAFFGTPLLTYLTAHRIDTVLLVGCSTSGCIRATALEGMQHGFRVVIPRECVGDRTQAVHDANLHDCHAKICDVLPKAAVLDYLRALPATGSSCDGGGPDKRARR